MTEENNDQDNDQEQESETNDNGEAEEQLEIGGGLEIEISTVNPTQPFPCPMLDGQYAIFLPVKRTRKIQPTGETIFQYTDFEYSCNLTGKETCVACKEGKTYEQFNQKQEQS